MNNQDLSFNDLPQAVATLLAEVQELKIQLQKTSTGQESDKDYWMNIQELRKYLPNHPAEQTIYGWTSQKKIPFHKASGGLVFKKSEIDQWLISSKQETFTGLMAAGAQFIFNKKRR